MKTIQYVQEDKNLISLLVFQGRTITRMPELISQGYFPISIAQIMMQRILAYQSEDQGQIDSWRNFFDSGDTIIYHPDGRAKVICDSKTLIDINLISHFRWNGSLVLPEGTFDKAQGEEFSRLNFLKYTHTSLEQNEISENPILLALTRGDKKLLSEYVKLSNKYNVPLKIWTPFDKPRVEAERSLGLNYFSVESKYSILNYAMNSGKGRFVAIPKKDILKIQEEKSQKSQRQLLLEDLLQKGLITSQNVELVKGIIARYL